MQQCLGGLFLSDSTFYVAFVSRRAAISSPQSWPVPPIGPRQTASQFSILHVKRDEFRLRHHRGALTMPRRHRGARLRRHRGALTMPRHHRGARPRHNGGGAMIRCSPWNLGVLEPDCHMSQTRSDRQGQEELSDWLADQITSSSIGEPMCS